MSGCWDAEDVEAKGTKIKAMKGMKRIPPPTPCLEAYKSLFLTKTGAPFMIGLELISGGSFAMPGLNS
jgi:hypothetical protein